MAEVNRRRIVFTKQDIEDRTQDEVEEYLEVITDIDDDAARILGKRNFFLPLDRVQQISVATARLLAKTSSHLRLNGVLSLTPDLAQALAERPDRSQSLALNGISTITVEEAEILSQVKCHRLELGLLDLPDDVAKVLGKREGDLSLCRLSALSDTAAAELGSVGGQLALQGIATLSDKAAKGLSRIKNEGLNLDGLRTLSQKACVLLAKKFDSQAGLSTNPMKPGTPVCQYRSEAVSARNEVFFRLLFAERVAVRAKAVASYQQSSSGAASIRKVESLIDVDPQGRSLSKLACLTLSVPAAIKLSFRDGEIRCPGFLGFHDAEENHHDWGRIGEAIIRFLQKVPNHGPRCASLGGLLIELLLASSDPRALGELLRASRAITIADTRQWIDTRVAWKTRELGTSTRAVEDMSIETHGFSSGKDSLDGGGSLLPTPQRKRDGRSPIGTKKVEIDGIGSVEISILSGSAECFVRAKGDRQPLDIKAVRKANKAAATALSTQCKAIDGTLRDIKRRLESTWCSAATWTWGELNDQWFQHPLVFPIAQRLIWRFECKDGVQDGLWDGATFVNVGGAPLRAIDPDARAYLWHPAHSPQTVEAWRRRLIDLRVEQPIRQAFREVYLVTDAERSALSRSARFAGHILQQSQFAALCRNRGWRVSLVGPFDSRSFAEQTVIDHKVSVSWSGEPVGEETSGTFYRLIRMGEVLFKPPMANISPIVFSELMRDLDLFVSVSSIGVDPSWESAESSPALRDYWLGYNSGDLSETARVRREALEIILSGLPSSSRFSLEKKHLAVDGVLGRYRIHLQSGAVFQQPSNRHLCIVPKASASPDRLALLVGDPLLSLIVSKALLLANDDTIKDRSILSQIKQ